MGLYIAQVYTYFGEKYLAILKRKPPKVRLTEDQRALLVAKIDRARQEDYRQRMLSLFGPRLETDSLALPEVTEA